jgi:Holliday junction resolvase
LNTYRRGRIAEKKVANILEDRGFENVRRSAGSRGPADIYATKGGTKYYIQAKTGSASVSREEIRDLRALARDRRGVAATVHYDQGETQWRFYGNWSRRKRSRLTA